MTDPIKLADRLIELRDRSDRMVGYAAPEVYRRLVLDAGFVAVRDGPLLAAALRLADYLDKNRDHAARNPKAGELGDLLTAYRAAMEGR